MTRQVVTLRGKSLPANRAAVMAIINRTPDSFFDGGATFAADAAVEAVDRAIADGADLVDIGGVKAGVGEPVSVAEEIDRVIPIISAVRQAHPTIPISVDTWRSPVAEEACQAGVDLINDTWAGADGGLKDIAARYGTGIVCSHTGGAIPRTNPLRVSYSDIVTAVIDETTAAAQQMVDAGVPRAGIIIDPTHDFGKNTYHGLELIRRTRELVDTGWPVLMALSNKDFIGETLDVSVQERLNGTLAATALAAAAGAAIFRAHHVIATRQVIDMVAAIQGEKQLLAVRRGMV